MANTLHTCAQSCKWSVVPAHRRTGAHVYLARIFPRLSFHLTYNRCGTERFPSRYKTEVETFTLRPARRRWCLRSARCRMPADPAVHQTRNAMCRRARGIGALAFMTAHSHRGDLCECTHVCRCKGAHGFYSGASAIYPNCQNTQSIKVGPRLVLDFSDRR